MGIISILVIMLENENQIIYVKQLIKVQRVWWSINGSHHLFTSTVTLDTSRINLLILSSIYLSIHPSNFHMLNNYYETNIEIFPRAIDL